VDDSSNIAHPRGLGGWAEYVGPQETQVLCSRVRDTRPAPLAHGWRLDVAKSGNGTRPAEPVNQLSVRMRFVHGRTWLGIPTVQSIGIPTARRIRLA